MKYLWDVNALIALVYVNHSGHRAVSQWYAAHRSETFYLSSVIEMGFMRVSLQTGLIASIPEARTVLMAVKKAASFDNVADDLGAEDLPDYVTTARQVTDGHLLALAHKNGAQLATLDKGIPDALLVGMP